MLLLQTGFISETVRIIILIKNSGFISRYCHCFGCHKNGQCRAGAFFLIDIYCDYL